MRNNPDWNCRMKKKKKILDQYSHFASSLSFMSQNSHMNLFPSIPDHPIALHWWPSNPRPCLFPRPASFILGLFPCVMPVCCHDNDNNKYLS